MTPETTTVRLPFTREEALKQLADFLPRAGDDYARSRNHVIPGHANVSRLSPATRTRLLLETEICSAARAAHSATAVEKFEQEIWWRLYWKGWLEKRPSLWSDYRSDLARLDWSERALEVAEGRSGVAIMDYFAKELIETGYLHNHARMWWASFWIHVEKLPWQLGADFFLRHLLDGDAASNTLSWRWVAGLQTRGKSYLVRRSNLERYVDPALLAAHARGLERLEDPEAVGANFEDPPAARPVLSPASAPQADGRLGVWIHDEDLLPEISPLAAWQADAIFAPAPGALWDRHRFSERKQSFLKEALGDGAARAGEHFHLAPESGGGHELAAALIRGAKQHRIETLVAMHPFTGPLADEIDALTAALREAGVALLLLRRDEDVAAMHHASAGFFGFWKKTAALREGVPV